MPVTITCKTDSTCSTMIFSTGCKGISAPASGAPALAPSLTLVSAWLFLTVFFSFPSLPLWCFCSFLSTSSPRCHRLGRGSQLCPVVGLAQSSPGLSSKSPSYNPSASEHCHINQIQVKNSTDCVDKEHLLTREKGGKLERGQEPQPLMANKTEGKK